MSKFSDADPHQWCKSTIALLPAGIHRARVTNHGGRNVTVSFEEFIVGIHKFAKQLDLETEILPDPLNPPALILYITGQPRTSSKIKPGRVTFPIELNHAVQHGVKPAASNIFRDLFNLDVDDKEFFHDRGTLF